MSDSESQFLNVEAAHAFIEAHTDSIDREVLWMAYKTLTFDMASAPEGSFDVLFLFEVISKLLGDRDLLLQVMSGRVVE